MQSTQNQDINPPQDLKNVNINHLTHAVSEGRIDDVKRLLNLGIDINETDDDSFTPLQMAAKCGHYEIVKLILNKKQDIIKDPKNNNKDEYKALNWAVKNKHNEIVELILNNTTDLYDKDLDYLVYDADDTPLKIALDCKNLTAMELLLKGEIYAGARCALCEAIDQSEIEAVKCLLRYNVDFIGESGYYFPYAVQNIPMAKLLFDHNPNLLNEVVYEFEVGAIIRPEDVNLISTEANFLQYAIFSHELETVKWLINEKGAVINDDLNPVHYAMMGTDSQYPSVINDALAMLKFLDDLGCDFGKLDDKGYKPMHYIVGSYQCEFIKHMLDNYSGMQNTQDSQGNTLLHLAILGNQYKLIHFLIDNKLYDINIKNNQNKSPIELVRDRNLFGKEKSLVDPKQFVITTENWMSLPPDALIRFKDREAGAVRAKLIIAGADITNVVDSLTDKLNALNLLLLCKPLEQFIVIKKLYQFVSPLTMGRSIVIDDKTAAYFFETESKKERKKIKNLQDILLKVCDRIIEYLNKKSWDRTEQIKCCEEIIKFKSEDKYSEYTQKFYNEVQNRKMALQTNDNDILGILSSALKTKISKLANKDSEPSDSSIALNSSDITKLIRSFLTKEDIKNTYEAAMFNTNAFNQAQEIKEHRLASITLSDKSLAGTTEDVERSNKKIKNDFHDQKKSRFNPASFNDLFTIGNIKSVKKEDKFGQYCEKLFKYAGVLVHAKEVSKFDLYLSALFPCKIYQATKKMCEVEKVIKEGLAQGILQLPEDKDEFDEVLDGLFAKGILQTLEEKGDKFSEQLYLDINGNMEVSEMYQTGGAAHMQIDIDQIGGTMDII